MLNTWIHAYRHPISALILAIVRMVRSCFNRTLFSCLAFSSACMVVAASLVEPLEKKFSTLPSQYYEARQLLFRDEYLLVFVGLMVGAYFANELAQRIERFYYPSHNSPTSSAASLTRIGDVGIAAVLCFLVGAIYIGLNEEFSRGDISEFIARVTCCFALGHGFFWLAHHRRPESQHMKSLQKTHWVLIGAMGGLLLTASYFSLFSILLPFFGITMACHLFHALKLSRAAGEDADMHQKLLNYLAHTPEGHLSRFQHPPSHSDHFPPSEEDEHMPEESHKVLSTYATPSSRHNQTDNPSRRTLPTDKRFPEKYSHVNKKR